MMNSYIIRGASATKCADFVCGQFFGFHRLLLFGLCCISRSLSFPSLENWTVASLFHSHILGRGAGLLLCRSPGSPNWRIPLCTRPKNKKK